MASLVGRRLIALVAVMFGLVVIVFALQAVIPSDPVRAMVGASATPQVVAPGAPQAGLRQAAPRALRRLPRPARRTATSRRPCARATRSPRTSGRSLRPRSSSPCPRPCSPAVLGVGLGLLLVGGGRGRPPAAARPDRRGVGADLPDGPAGDPALLLDAPPAPGVRPRLGHARGPQRPDQAAADRLAAPRRAEPLLERAHPPDHAGVHARPAAGPGDRPDAGDVVRADHARGLRPHRPVEGPARAAGPRSATPCATRPARR